MLRRHEDLCSNALKKRAQFMTARLLELTNPGTEKKDHTSSPKASLDERVGDLKRRLFSGGKIRSGQRISSQLNVFNRQQLKSMHLLLDGVDDFDVDDDVAYGDVGILHMAAARRPRIHRLASAHTTNLRNQLEIADTWWTDKLPNRPASWDGHKTGFIFFEEVTTYAFLYLSEQGRAQDFIRALKALFVDLQRRRPGAHVRRIRGDMDSAYSHQGDINSPLTHELHEFLSQHPGLSIVPVAPHAHELNRAENPMGLINRNLLANYVRSWLGERAWGDLLHNAVFGYNHVSAPSSHDRQARIQTRYHRFTGRRLVASDVKGFGGEFGWRVLREGKASTGDVRAVPIYYIMADPDAGTHVLRCLRSFKVLRSRDVIMGDGSVLRSALALRPGIGRPRGMVGEPPRAAFESRLDELITDWRPDNLALTTIVVDKLSGMPTGTIRFEPHYDQDGCLTLVPNTKPLAEGGGGASDGGRDSDGTTTAGVGQKNSGSASAAAGTWDWFMGLPENTPILFNKSAKEPAQGKPPSKSCARYRLYCTATTKGQLGVLKGKRLNDIKWDLLHGNMRVALPRREREHMDSRLIMISEAPSPTNAHRLPDLPDGVRPERAELWDSNELLNDAKTSRLLRDLERMAYKERDMLKVIIGEERKEDAPHA
jgi:hypothetical protein